MPRDVKRALKTYLEVRRPTGEGLFTGREGTLGYKRIARLFKHYATKARVDPKYSVHALRHAIAVHLLDAGLGVEFVKDHLGHVNIQNTIRGFGKSTSGRGRPSKTPSVSSRPIQGDEERYRARKLAAPSSGTRSTSL